MSPLDSHSRSQDARDLPELVRSAWERGETKLLEELCGIDTLRRMPAAEFLDLVYAEYLARQRAGQTPPLNEYLTRFPEHQASIERLFALHQELGSVAVAGSLGASLAGERLSPPVRMGHPVADAEFARDPPSAEGSARVGRSEAGLDSRATLGEYRIVRQLGRGGMGVVYEAIQEPLGRRVALKVLPDAAAREPLLVERFQREARAAAGLQHSNIVPVYGVGVDDGRHYYAMQFVDGRPLDAVLAELRDRRNASPAAGTAFNDSMTQPQRVGTNDETRSYAASPDVEAAQGKTPVSQRRSTVIHLAGGELTRAEATGGRAGDAPIGPDTAEYFRWVAALGQRAAEALAYAHAQGCIHRDIKPSNLMLDRAGTIWITDFGLAMLADMAGLTASGEVLGTLRYMAPEQMRGDASEVSDVYSLGITLYELVTLQPAFDDVLRGRLMDRVQREEPIAPRQLEPKLPLDLETIILKAITKETSRRYRSAAELADDLQRYLDDRPIQGRRIGWGGRLVRWYRRNKAVAALLTSIAFILITSSLVASFLAWRYYEQRGVARTNEQRAIKSEGVSLVSERDALRRLQQARISAAETAAGGDQIGRQVNAIRFVKEALELGGQIEKANQRIAAGLVQPAPENEPGLTAEDRLRCRDAAVQAMLQTDFEEVLDWPGATLKHGFSCDSAFERYAWAKNGLIELREFAGQRLIASLQRGQGASVTLSGNGRRLLISEPGIAPRTTQLTAFEVAGENQPPRALLVHPETAGSPNGPRYRFSPDGRWLLFQSPAGKLVLRELGGDRRYEWEVGFIASLAFSHQSDLCSVAHSLGETKHVLQVFQVADGKLQKELDLKSKAFSQAFHHAWHPDRKRLVLDTTFRTASIWSLESGRRETGPALPDRRSEGGQSEFSPSGKYLTWADRGGLLQVYDMERREIVLSIPVFGRRCDWSPDERTLISGSPQENGRLRLLRMIASDNGRLVRLSNSRSTLQKRFVGAWHVVASPRDPIIAADLRTSPGLASGAEVVLIDTRTARECRAIAAPMVRPIAFQQDGSLVICGVPALQHWPRGDDAEAGLPFLGPPQWIAGDPSAHPHGADRAARQVAVPRVDHAVLMTIGKQNSSRKIGSGTDIFSACLDPTGKWLVTGDAGLQVWDVSDGKLLKSLESPSSTQIGFSPDGAYLWSIGGGSAIYRTSDWERVGPIDATSITFADSGRLVATSDPEGILHLRDARTWNVVLRIRPPGESRFLPKCFYNGELGLAVHDEAAASLRLYDLAPLRRGLRALELDWSPEDSLDVPKSEFTGLMLRGRGFSELFDAMDKLESVSLKDLPDIAKRLEQGVKSGPLAEAFVLECQWRLAWLTLAFKSKTEQAQRGRDLARQILSIKPEHEPARLALAFAHYRLGDDAEAEKSLLPLLDKGDSTPFLAATISALIRLRAKDEAGAAAARERAARLRFLSAASGNVDSLTRFLAQSLEGELGGNPSVAQMAAIRRFIEVDQTADASLLYHIGCLSVVVYKNPAVASVALSRAISLGGVPADAHWFLAMSWDQLGRGELAREQAERVLTKIPKHHGALELLGHLAARRGDWASAERHWQESLPGKPWRTYELALLKIWTPFEQDRGAALALAEAWQHPDGAGFKSFEMRGLALWLRGNPEEALKVLDEAAKLETARNPKYGANGFNRLLRAHILAEQGQRERASELIAEARTWRESLGAVLPAEQRTLVELGETTIQRATPPVGTQ